MYLGLFSLASQISLGLPISFLKSTGLATSILGRQSLVFKHLFSPPVFSVVLLSQMCLIFTSPDSLCFILQQK